MISKTFPRANARVLLGASVAGTALILGLSGAYVAGANAPTAMMHARAQRLASAASTGFSDAALQQNLTGMAPGALAIAERHDPQIIANSGLRDRAAAAFAARLERSDPAPSGPTLASSTSSNLCKIRSGPR